VGDWKITSEKLGIKSPVPFTIEKKRLHGGRQGVDLLIVDNGVMKITLVPTRGMGIKEVKAADLRLGWDSPVKEVVNPAFIDLESRGGLGWLDGFNEMLVRCGYEWTGHPGVDDDGRLKTPWPGAEHSRLRGQRRGRRAYAIHVLGRVDERTFKMSELVTWTQLSVVPGQAGCPAGQADQPRGLRERVPDHLSRQLQGPHSGGGARVSTPVKQISPFNDYAKGRTQEAGKPIWGPPRASTRWCSTWCPTATPTAMPWQC
jgi:hypothetical protein